MKYIAIFLLSTFTGCSALKPLPPLPVPDPESMEESNVWYNLNLSSMKDCYTIANRELDRGGFGNIQRSQRIVDKCRTMASPSYRKQLRSRIVQLHPEWPEKDKEAIVNGSIYIGMKEEYVKACLGTPEKANSTITSSGKREQWVYGSGNYVYLKNGRVTAIQH